MCTYRACAADRESRTYIDPRMVYVLGSEYKQNGEKTMKKFELTSEFKMFLGRKLYRIKALVSFGNVSDGELGGFVEKEENLSHDGDAWVCGNAKVYGNAEVYGNAKVYGDADYAVVKGFGSRFRTTTFFRQKDKSIGVRCGCFYGTLDAFRNKVKETHGETKMAKEYLMIAELMEYHFEGEGEKNDNRDSSN